MCTLFADVIDSAVSVACQNCLYSLRDRVGFSSRFRVIYGLVEAPLTRDHLRDVVMSHRPEMSQVVWQRFRRRFTACVSSALCRILRYECSPKHVSGAERQNFPLIAQLHLRESRSPLRSRSDDLPLRSAHLTFWPAPLPLRSKAGFKGGEVRAPNLFTNRSPPTTSAELFSFLADK